MDLDIIFSMILEFFSLVMASFAVKMLYGRDCNSL